MKRLSLITAFVFIIAASVNTEAVTSDTLTFAYTEYPPFTYTAEDGKAAGFSVDILQAMFQQAGIKAEMEAFPWKRAEMMVSQEKNILVFCARIAARENLYEWIGPVYPRTLSLYKLKNRSDIQIKGIEDVLRCRIGVVRGYASVNELTKIGIPEKNLDETSDEILNIRKLYGNRLDLIPNNDMVLSYNLKKEGRSLNDVEKVFDITKEGVNDFHFAINKETDRIFVESLRQAFDRIKTDGTYDAVLRKYIQ